MIILTLNGKVLQEVPLSKERITIGRRPHNDIVIEDLAISAEHAVIVTILKDSFLEDLNSTNGTQINGQPVKKHFLQDNDVIELAHYRLRYVAGLNNAKSRGALPEERQPMRRANSLLQAQCEKHDEVLSESRKNSDDLQFAVIRILNGPSAGKQIPLTKVLTTIGRPGVQVAVITYRPQGYSITHVEGENYPLVNGQSIGAGAQPMVHGDVIDLSGTQMKFLIS